MTLDNMNKLVMLYIGYFVVFPLNNYIGEREIRYQNRYKCRKSIHFYFSANEYCTLLELI